MGAVREAEAYAFEVAMVRALGKLTNLNVSRFPNWPSVNAFIDRWVYSFKEGLYDLTQEHDRALLLLWLAVLDDPLLADVKQDLHENLALSSDSLMAVHSHFLDLSPQRTDSYVNDLLGKYQRYRNSIVAKLSKRLASVRLEGFIKYNLTPALVP